MTEPTPIQTITPEPIRRKHIHPVFSVVLRDGALAEIVYDLDEQKSRFAIWRDGAITLEKQLQIGTQLFVPYSPQNSLIQNEVILLPSEAKEYGSEEQLIGRISGFLHRYMDISPVFEKLASYYVLLTWIYDSFNELPYLRVQGDAGSGKTRFLLILGSLCYKPIFASGASTVSPLFRILDACRGTLIIDEGDFRLSDEKTEIIKILNQGHARGFPVLRSESDNKREFSPRAYQVFGPKIVATRGLFDDRALESRCLTELLGGRRLRDDIPINMSEAYKAEALEIRNQLLMFRFHSFGKVRSASWIDRHLEPRLNQVFAPLMSIIDDPEARRDLQNMAHHYQKQLVSDRSVDAEAQLLEIIQELETSVSGRDLGIKDLTSRFIQRYEDEYDRKITPRWIGSLIRQKLGLGTERHRGGYAIAASEKAKLPRLYEKYGLTEPEEAV